MKHKFLLLATMFSFLQIQLFAEHVSANKASLVGMNFMKQKYSYITTRGEALKMYKSIKLTQVTNRSVDNQHFYIFNLNDNQGWVLVADDDRCIPILGYSKSGEFVTENLSANIEDWLVGISSEIQYIIDNNIIAEPHHYGKSFLLVYRQSSSTEVKRLSIRWFRLDGTKRLIIMTYVRTTANMAIAP